MHKNYSETYELEFAHEFYVYRDYIASVYREELNCNKHSISKYRYREQATNSKRYVNSLVSSLKFLAQCTQIKDIIGPSLIICHSSRHFEICQELGGITKQTLYRYVSPDGELRDYGNKVLDFQN